MWGSIGLPVKMWVTLDMVLPFAASLWRADYCRQEPGPVLWTL